MRREGPLPALSKLLSPAPWNAPASAGQLGRVRGRLGSAFYFIEDRGAQKEDGRNDFSLPGYKPE